MDGSPLTPAQQRAKLASLGHRFRRVLDQTGNRGFTTRTCSVPSSPQIPPLTFQLSLICDLPSCRRLPSCSLGASHVVPLFCPAPVRNGAIPKNSDPELLHTTQDLKLWTDVDFSFPFFSPTPSIYYSIFHLTPLPLLLHSSYFVLLLVSPGQRVNRLAYKSLLSSTAVDVRGSLLSRLALPGCSSPSTSTRRP